MTLKKLTIKCWMLAGAAASVWSPMNRRAGAEDVGARAWSPQLRELVEELRRTKQPEEIVARRQGYLDAAVTSRRMNIDDTFRGG